MKRSEAEAAFWHALEAVAKKHAVRKDLPQGSALGLSASITAQVGAVTIEKHVAGQVKIGHECEKARSHGVSPALLLAYLLRDVGPRKRLTLVADLLEQHAAGAFDELDDALVETCDQVVKQLRVSLPSKTQGASVGVTNLEVSKAA